MTRQERIQERVDRSISNMFRVIFPRDIENTTAYNIQQDDREWQVLIEERKDEVLDELQKKLDFTFIRKNTYPKFNEDLL